eukprot:324875_1
MSWWNNNNDNNNNNNNNNSTWNWGTNNNNNNNTTNNNTWGTNNNTTNTNNNNNNNNNNNWGSQTSSSNLNPNNDHMISSPPSDAISSMRFNPSHDLLAVSSWNNNIQCYQYTISNGNEIKTRLISEQKHDRGVLCCNWDSSGSSIFSGSCDTTVRIWNISKNSFITLGNHNAGVKCIEYSSDFNILISGSWDRTLIYWDIRSGQKISVINLPAKVFCSSQKGNVFIIGLSNKYVQVYDLRNFKQYMSLEKTVLKHQLRCMDIFPDQRGYVCSSIEGRTAIKHFDKYDSKNDFSFKCHRHQRGNDKHSQDVFAVNCLKFHKQFGTFATGGDDGQINIWDKEGRSRLKHFEQIKLNNGNNTN